MSKKIKIYIKCPRCNGHGDVGFDGEAYVCKMCKGTGKVFLNER